MKAPLFRSSCVFVKGCADMAHLPNVPLPEVAFAGRSNCGKSSLINALVNRKGLVKTSKTPGRTRELNYFCLGNRLHLVDMPGYGYSKAPRAEVARWNEFLPAYLAQRKQLRTVFVLLDSRHGLLDTDRMFFEAVRDSQAPLQVVFTKCDKVSHARLDAMAEQTTDELSQCPPVVSSPVFTSSRLGLGLDALQSIILSTMAPEERSTAKR